MTDIDGGTGEVIENLPITTTGEWSEKIKNGYADMAHKTVPAILEFAAEVKAFRDACEGKQGGSTFATMMTLWVGFNQGTSSRWLSIGECAKLMPSGHKLPSSWRTISELTQLPSRKFNECINDGRINPLMTRAQAKELKPESTRKSPISKVREAEDLYQERLKKIINVFETMSIDDMHRAVEYLNTFIVKIGESDE